jgi:hypothetical protein
MRMATIPVSYRRGLASVARAESSQLASLRRCWEQIRSQIEKRRRLIARIVPDDDPIRLPVDLLAPIGCGQNENLHTQALAYLCDESKEHGLNRRVLICVLQTIKKLCPRASATASSAARALYMLGRKGTDIDVKPEYKHDTGRCDIWIKLCLRNRYALIVIENKIGAQVRPEQLAGYKSEAKTWCKHHHAPQALLVLLAKKNTEQNDWVSLGYLQLASALRKAWLDNKDTRGGDWLGLYIASIATAVLGIDVNNEPEAIKPIDLQTYMDGSWNLSPGGKLMSKKLIAPAISREFDFYVRNASIMDEIGANDNTSSTLRELTVDVYDRAEASMCRLLQDAQSALRAGAKNRFRADWGRRISREEWEWWAPIYTPGRGPRKRIGSVGVFVSFVQKDPALKAWARLRGGAKGQEQLMHVVEKIDGVTKENDYVCWFDETIKLATTRDELHAKIKKAAGVFFKAAKPVLR